MSRTAAPAVGSELQQLCSRGDRRGLCPGTPTNSCTAALPAGQGPNRAAFIAHIPTNMSGKRAAKKSPALEEPPERKKLKGKRTPRELC